LRGSSEGVRHDKTGAVETEAVEKQVQQFEASFDLGSVWDTIADMKTIRTFIAIPLGDEVLRKAIRMIERLKQPSDGIKWVPTDNLHLTLKFLGEVDNTEVPAVCNVVHDVCADRDPFELHFAGTDGFPSIDRPRVLYIKIEDTAGALTDIVSELEDQYADLGFKRESRDYTPHLTIGRTKGGSRRAGEDVIKRLRSEDQTEIGAMLADSVHVIASFLDKRGPTYQVMDTVEL
jgi:2'-5' RNA ligase